MIHWFRNLPGSYKAVVVCTLLMVGLGIIQSMDYTLTNRANDLRNRVVGARLIHSDQSPYFYKWHPGDPEYLLEPASHDYAIEANALTVSPGMLYVHALFSWLPYPMIRTGWTILLYFTAFAIFAMLLKASGSTVQNEIYVIAVGGIFFLSTGIWFWNISTGQLYLFYAAAMLLIYHLYKSQTAWKLVAAGVLIALTTWCRLNFIIVTIPLLLTFNRKIIAGGMVAGLLLLAHAYTQPKLWKDYFRAMEMHTSLHGGPKIKKEVIYFPSNIEGRDYTPSYTIDAAAGFPTLRWSMVNRGFHNKYVYVILFGTVLAALLFFYRNVIRAKDPQALLLIGFLLYILSEFFIPASRAGYNLVQWIVPLGLMLHDRKVTTAHVATIVSALCLMVSFPVSVRFTHSLSEFALVGCLMHFIWYRYGPKAVAKATVTNDLST